MVMFTTFARRLLLAIVVVCALNLNAFGQHVTNSPAHSAGDTNAVKAEMDAAIHQVEKIVNQPVTAYRAAPDTQFSVFKEGWFHPGAMKPDFDKVDVRQTQETPYAKYPLVSSDLNPGIVFVGSQLEFNSMTKYFYTNRTLPKKKLTDAEMQEINRLYRIIGRCEHQLSPPPPALATDSPSESGSAATSGAATAPTRRSIFLNPWIAGGLICGLVLVVLFSRLARS
jgi:hypothetical protein